MKSKVFQNPSQSTTGFENFGEGFVGCKITEDKVLNMDLYKHEVTPNLDASLNQTNADLIMKTM